MPTVLDLTQRFRRQLDARERAAIERLVRAYAAIKRAVDAQIDALLMELELMQAPSVAKVQRLARLRQLREDVTEQLTEYQSYLRIELQQEAAAGVALGEAHATGYLAELGISFNRLNPTAIESLLGFLVPDGPLYARLGELANTTADRVVERILEGVGLGRNPRAIAGDINRAFGVGLEDALRMMRTAQNYAYRDANHLTYLANEGVVTGWQWFANLQTCCLSCLALHGSVHPLSERLNDHHNGGCTPVPIVAGRQFVEGTGEDYFDALPEHLQLRRMGPGRHEAWLAGEFDFAAMTKSHDDEVYGEMRVETPLKELLGE